MLSVQTSDLWKVVAVITTAHPKAPAPQYREHRDIWDQAAVAQRQA